jgi:hypothetical protein
MEYHNETKSIWNIILKQEIGVEHDHQTGINVEYHTESRI